MKRLLFIALLFGMISQAVEPVKIKDVNGVEFTLDLIQKNALQRCKTFEPFLVETEHVEGMEEGPIDFEKVQRPFITQTNIQQLADIIANPEKIKKITEHKCILELFQLADYAMAPKKIVRALGQDAKSVIAERSTELNALASLNDEQAIELYNLRVAQQARENGKFDVNELLRKLHKKNLPLNTVLDYDSMTDETCIDLSYEKSKKVSLSQLQSLNGTQKLVFRNEKGHAKDDKVKSLKLDNHNVEKIDLANLKKHFPQLQKLSLKNNLIKQVSELQPIRKLEVDLTCNPLESITIKNPERCNYLQFKTDKADVKVDFAQNKFSKMHTWLKSFWAKSKNITSCYFPTTQIAIICAGLCVGGSLIGGWLAKQNDAWKADDALDGIVLANGQKVLLSGENLVNNFKEQALSELVNKYGGQACVTTLRKVTPSKSEVPIEFFTQSSVKLGLKVYGALQFLGSGLIISVDTLISRCAEHTTMPDYYLKENMRKNPYRIQVNMGKEQLIKEFPSNYTYKLFGKN